MCNILMRILCLAAGSILIAASPCHAKHYKIWVKAFIPNTELDIVKLVPNDNGLTMIPGPHIAGLPIDPDCYNTNNRSFDSSVDADAKMTMVLDFDLRAPGLTNVKKSAPLIGKTIRYDCESGGILKTGQAANTDIKIGDPSFDAGKVNFTLDGEASNPLVSPSPAIKIHGTIYLDTAVQNIAYKGKITKFPAFEAYMSVDNSSPTAIFQIAPAHDASPWSLFLSDEIDRNVPYH